MLGIGIVEADKLPTKLYNKNQTVQMCSSKHLSLNFRGRGREEEGEGGRGRGS